jgi:hypothetical protein
MRHVALCALLPCFGSAFLHAPPPPGATRAEVLRMSFGREPEAAGPTPAARRKRALFSGVGAGFVKGAVSLKDGLWDAYDGVQDWVKATKSSSLVGGSTPSALSAIGRQQQQQQSETQNALLILWASWKGLTGAVQAVTGSVKDGIYDAPNVSAVVSERVNLAREEQRRAEMEKRQTALSRQAEGAARWAAIKSAAWSAIDFTLATGQFIASAPAAAGQIARTTSAAAARVKQLPAEVETVYVSTTKSVADTVDGVKTGYNNIITTGTEIVSKVSDTAAMIADAPRMREEARKKAEAASLKKKEEEEERARAFKVANEVLAVTGKGVTAAGKVVSTIASLPKVLSEAKQRGQEVTEKAARLVLEPIYEYDQRQARIEIAKAQQRRMLQPASPLSMSSAVENILEESTPIDIIKMDVVNVAAAEESVIESSTDAADAAAPQPTSTSAPMSYIESLEQSE